jgi:hypothetical protein
MMIDSSRTHHPVPLQWRGAGFADCVVTVLQPRNAAGYLGEAEVRALGVLADAGMIAPLRFEPAGQASYQRQGPGHRMSSPA